ncbi:MAG: hypothetical protein QOJ02_891 [Acidobacteriota bacterium]|jgi:O-antigen/teichoic acid export membrane protein|nr:hypothetical protein [Acidobacteriota bacterium]
MGNLVLLIFGLSVLKALTGFAWVVVFVGVVTFGLTLYGLARQKPLATVHNQRLMTKEGRKPHWQIFFSSGFWILTPAFTYDYKR